MRSGDAWSSTLRAVRSRVPFGGVGWAPRLLCCQRSVARLARRQFTVHARRRRGRDQSARDLSSDLGCVRF